MINRLSNPINRNRSAAKISKVMSSSFNTSAHLANVRIERQGLILDPPAEPEPGHPFVLPAVQQLLTSCVVLV